MAKSEQRHLWSSPLFRDLVADRVRFSLTRYFSRKDQVADIMYNDAILNTGFPVPRDFALAFCAENPLKPGERRKIRLKINGKRYDALFERTGVSREYLIKYEPLGDVAHALRGYLPKRLKPGETAFHIRVSGKSELLIERFPSSLSDLLCGSAASTAESLAVDREMA